MTVHCPSPEAAIDEPLHIYVANAMALRPNWQFALLRLHADGPLYRLAMGRFYGKRGEARERLVHEKTARCLERDGYVRFGFIGNQHVPALYATDRGKRYGIALAIIAAYEKRRASLAGATTTENRSMASTETPIRIQRKRAKGWRMPPNTVYVGRPTKWGNPFNFQSSEYCLAALSFGCRGDRAGRQLASVKAFRDWIDPPHGRQTLSFEDQPKMANSRGDIALGPPIKAGAAPSRVEIREELRGKNLACFCPIDQPCHADVLLEIANG